MLALNIFGFRKRIQRFSNAVFAQQIQCGKRCAVGVLSDAVWLCAFKV